VGDLVMWDNRQTMHRARPFPASEPRDMRRTTLMSEGPTVSDGGPELTRPVGSHP
jgi:alpha-ketoglutarate-dependent 2,4-dichlorophenoxyacetate dioxygenase